ncbi:hypothetical protein OG500_34290 [Kitasatospora sp. NBC_01250]|uniref:hypothetical protein n=1 Tax=Kitasatospora sp. NBC_01250 TaxID=2903571 RepID=UPI002E35CCFD|nr:hypothetical protein [Kitasatospora sp. NBC_01250]
MYRQGDVLLVPVDPSAASAEAGLVEQVERAGRAGLTKQQRDARGRLVLALGEVTGHAHAVVGPGELLRDPGAFGAAWLHLPEGGRVVHEEHAAIALPRGWYRVVRQREYAPGAVRVVAD